MAKRTIINDNIPSIDVPWDDGTQAYSGAAVERFLKQQISSKIGYFIIPQDKDTDGYYHLWGFATQSDYNDYMSDRVGNAALRLLNTAIPLLEEQGGVSNIVTLTRNSAANIVTNKPVASVEVSYLWQQYNPITKETTDQDEDATIVVSCRTQNANGAWGAWDNSKEFSVGIQSGQTKTIDISGILTSDATYQVRLVATGETSQISATPVTVTVVYSNVSSSYEGSIATPYTGNSIQLPFRISGSVQKQLRIKINGYTKNYSLGTTTYVDNTFGATVSRSEFNLARGAVKAEAWIAFGNNFAAETEHQTFQFIYIPEGDESTAPILAVTDVMPEFENWTRATIFKYAIYNPAANETFLRITLQDSDTGQTYLVNETTCVNGEGYDFDENFSMEVEGDEQPPYINAQAVFTNATGLTYGNNVSFVVDNRENFAPTKGANVIVSAEKRQITVDGVEYDLTDLLQDTQDTNSGWKANAEVDSAGTTVNIPVLSVGAGNRFTIPFELFDANTGLNENGVEGSLTAEFDLKVKNIVGDAVIIDASAPFDRAYTGLRFYPTKAACLSRNNFTEDICDVRFQEEVREHITVNIIRNLRGEGLNLVRIYVNGKANRSYMYTAEDSFIPIGAAGSPEIVIGSDEADVDIYGIRIYKGQQLGSTQIQNDYMAGMPTIEDKKLFKRFNSIYNGSEISYDQCNAMGLNTILRRIPVGGHYPSRENQEKQKGVSVDVRIYAERGNPDSLDSKHSGTFTGMTANGQGTSAKGYYWWNITDKFEDDVEIEASEYDASNPTHYVKDGVHYRKLSYFNSLDGTSQVYSSKYELEEGRGGITKLVGKCNYASPMQSHKAGAIWAYDELWQRLVNDGSNSRPVLRNTHAACYEKPFICFYQIGESNPVFCGLQTWGSGKGDKKTFGYDKTASPAYMCVSGADNGAIAALFQMPWIVSKNAAGAWTGNIYAKSVTINTGDVKNGYCYKSGSSDNLAFEVEIGSKYDGGETDKGVLRIKDEAKGQTENTLYTTFAEFCNFVCSCSPLLKPYPGTEAQLIADSANLTRDHQYWLFNSQPDRYTVYYFNPETSRYEKLPMMARTWAANGRAATFGNIPLTEQLAGMVITIDTATGQRSVTLEEALNLLGIADMNVVNDCFCKARVAYFKAHADAYADIPDAIFHQCFIKLFAGTDNRTKNVYPWIDPAIDKLVRWKQDDLDTILATDNQGRQTKPYHVLEHTNDRSGSNYWNGENNVFFTLIERAYPERMINMMRDMFAAMSQICGSVENYMQQRFYWIQEYFPAVAYNETSRVLYEVAQVKLNNGQIDVSQDPITQAVGDQLECEKQFMNQRLPMLMSWCQYETGGDGTLSFRSVSNRAGNAPIYDIEYTAYQYIYPKLAIGGNMAAVYAMVDGEWVDQGGEPYLCAPGETVRFVANTDSNTQLTMRWMHYAKSIGNIGKLPCGDDGNVTITGKRLRRLDCFAADNELIEFHPVGLSIANCRNLEYVNLTNASNFAGGFSAEMPRLRQLLLGGTAYTSVTLPKTSTLTEVTLPASINAISVNGQPNLSTLAIEGMENVRTLSIIGEHKLQRQTQSIVQMAYTQASNIVSIRVDNVNWTALAIDTMMWLARLNASLTGNIDIFGNLSYANKAALVDAYGDIDSQANPLFLTYQRRSISSIAIKGETYISTLGDHSFSLLPTPLTANDVAIRDGKLAVEWTLEEAGSVFATFSDAIDGTLSLTRLDDSNTDTLYTITCALTKSSGEVITNSVHVGFYMRIPKIGDFAYADGTFDDQYHKDKTVIGIVYKLNEIWKGESEVEPTVFNGYDKPTEAFKSTRSLVGYEILIDAKENVPYRSTDGAINTSSVAWGLYPNADTNGHGDLQSEIAEATGLSSVFDLANITNITSGALTGGTSNSYVLIGNYLDQDEDDGFKDYSSSIGAVVDWQGRQKTSTIIRHAKQMINSYLLSGDSSVNIECEGDDGVLCQLTECPETLTELADAMRTLLLANNGLTKFQQFLYPAAYGCYLYEPSVKEGETIDPQYRKNNWYLPAAGELMRQYSFFAKSRTGGMGLEYTQGQNTSPAKSVIDNMIVEALNSGTPNYINQNVSASHVARDEYTPSEIVAINRYFNSLIESERPIYSMAIWRSTIANNSSPIIQHSTGYHWTSTEYSASYAWVVSFYSGYISYSSKCTSLVVRPAVAYRFFL